MYLWTYQLDKPNISIFFLDEQIKQGPQNVQQYFKIQDTENLITISQSSARISYGEEPEGAATVGTKPENFGRKEQTSILTSGIKLEGRVNK